MDVQEHIDAIREQGVALADAAEAADLDAAVPTCPDWCIRDLVVHLGGVHRWATSFVTTGRTEPPGGGDELAPPPGDETLIEWFREGHAALVGGLESASPALDCWTFLPAPSPLAFWARRQAHETAIHRVDAESASGQRPTFPTLFAVDGIDELLLGFFARKRGRLVSDEPVTLGVRATDATANDAWTVSITSDGRHVSRGGAHGDCVVAGDASDLYQLLWNRRGLDGLAVTGDARVFDLWREKARITWS